MTSAPRSDDGAADGTPLPRRGAVARRFLPGDSEPDPRFTLANERTFLAWIRTGLAFIAGGVALAALGAGGLSAAAHEAIALSCIAAGMLIGLGAAARWWRVETSLRRGRPLPIPGIVPVLALVSAAAAGGAILMVVTG
ncbi:YidH family protein [Microbacterium sp. JZ31]|uniref:YidH family protein n=1 Tax=Microbacterium sp. JZ31 TaxID=1906274 RepID=UPI0019329B12|nr:DUF202 domain-containing protein [Microbacterium sp. JZ31]